MSEQHSDFHASFNDGDLTNFTNTGKSSLRMYKIHDKIIKVLVV